LPVWLRPSAGPSGLEGLEDLLEDVTGDETNKVKKVEEVQDDSDISVLPSQDAYLKMIGAERIAPPITEAESTGIKIIKVEELTNENEVMQSYINMLEDDIY